jgi:hypothetical protein
MHSYADSSCESTALERKEIQVGSKAAGLNAIQRSQTNRLRYFQKRRQKKKKGADLPRGQRPLPLSQFSHGELTMAYNKH